MREKMNYGELITKILKENGEFEACGSDFQTELKKAGIYFHRFMKNSHNPNKKKIIINPYSGKKAEVEDWIEFFQYEMLMSIPYLYQKFNEHDYYILDAIKTAILCHNDQIYYDFFD